MTYKEIAAVVSQIGIPAAYYQFPEGTEQATPFVCWYISGTDNFAADDTVYAETADLVIEVYTDNKDFALERKTAKILNDAGLVWDRVENWIESERMLQEVYNTAVLITAEEE